MAQCGDRHFNAKRWTVAADWFLAGSHQLFRAACLTSGAKYFRKAALCYIEQREYARATAISHDSEMKAVLLSVREAPLKTLKVENSGETVVEAMALIRCI
ncbi:hypothetical protein B0H16DRAFT_1664936 [Mycena metata]|uniref:Uncharacterized protein n=1 Tax=Mycena metata TaxID=1033252 RepID=A0AAD7MVV9_9AGAR|nr:hypothetical protein B0H16DRAFT_1664936 [Mycena metata]